MACRRQVPGIGKCNTLQYTLGGRVIANCLAPNRRTIATKVAVATASAHVGEWDDVALVSTTGKILDALDNPTREAAV